MTPTLFNNTEGDYVLYERSNLSLMNDCQRQGFLVKIYRCYQPAVIKKYTLTEGKQNIIGKDCIIHGIRPNSCNITKLWETMKYPDHILHVVEKDDDHQ